jgi:hypothetical protein
MTDRYKEAIQGAKDCVERNKDGGVYLPDLLVVIDSQQAEIERLSEALEIHKGIAEDWKYEAKRLKEMVGEQE